MAIVSSIAVGKARKSAGNVTFATLKGRTIMKEKPLSVANPNTVKQQVNRKAMGLAVYFWQNLGKYAKDGITRTTAYGSRYNRFIQNVLPFAQSTGASADNAGDVIPQGFKLTEGVISPLTPAVSSSDFHMSFDVDKSQLVEADIKIGDSLTAIVFDVTAQKTYKSTKILSASDLAGASASVDVSGFDLGLGGAFCSACYVVTADGKRSSTSTIVEQ